jgi:hypothetical protein
MFKYIAILLFFPTLLMAQEGKLSSRLNWYNRAIYRDPVTSFANPNNDIYKIDRWNYETDVRPSFTWEQGAHFFKLDPRLILISPDRHNSSEIFLNEASYQFTGDKHQFTVGLQNYQWGPAEMLSPSNPIFRFLIDQRSLFFQQRGRNLVRWNWTMNNSWSLVSMVEVSKNGVDLPREQQQFAPNGLIKLERTLEKSDNYLGLVTGVTPMQEAFVGEYGVLSFNDEVSMYFDARHQYQNHNFYPSHDTFYQNPYTQKKKDSQELYSLVTVGLRYEARVDFRLEYIYNGLGLTNSDWKNAQRSLTTLSPNLTSNFKYFNLSGRDLNLQHYAYASARISDLGPKNLYMVFLRHFLSLQDNSSLSQIQVDRETGENLNLYLEVSAYQGRQNKDFTLLISSEVSAGFRWSL